MLRVDSARLFILTRWEEKYESLVAERRAWEVSEILRYKKRIAISVAMGKVTISIPNIAS